MATCSATDPFRLASNEVHSWCVALDVPPETSAGLDVTLSHDERNRSARLRFARDRRRFIAARGVLRDLLGRYLGTRPGQIRFTYNAFGKPELSPEFGSRLRFNLSHSADLALIAITTEAGIGVDLEYIRPQPDHAEIARSFFSAAEVDQLNRLPSPLHTLAFFGCWTKKEAYVKACGEGLAIPLTSFSVPMATDPTHTLVDLGRPWSLYTLQPVPGYVGALAIEGTGWRLSQWHWQPHITRIEP
jgi:4'-phosphopantetheinyl transferase